MTVHLECPTLDACSFGIPGQPLGVYGDAYGSEEIVNSAAYLDDSLKQNDDLVCCEDVWRQARDIETSFLQDDALVLPEDFPRRGKILENGILSVLSSYNSDQVRNSLVEFMKDRYLLFQDSLARDKDTLIDFAVSNLGLVEASGVDLSEFGLSLDWFGGILNDTTLSPWHSIGAGVLGADGICQPNDNNDMDLSIVLRNRYGNPKTCERVTVPLKKLYAHESLHALGFSAMAGFAYGVDRRFGQGFSTSMLCETVVEHLTQVGLAQLSGQNGELGIIAPSFRSSNPTNESYNTYRELIGLLHECGESGLQGQEGTELMTRAWLSPRRSTGVGTYRREYMGRLSNALYKCLPIAREGGFGILEQAIVTQSGHMTEQFLQKTIRQIQVNSGFEILDDEPCEYGDVVTLGEPEYLQIN